MEYGSLVNLMSSNSSSVQKPIEEIKVGMGATELMFSDRHPYTVVSIKSKTRILVKRDEPYRIDKTGFGSECQEYFYREVTEEDFDSKEDYKNSFRELIKTKRGWKELGGSSRFSIGEREEYYDFTR